MPTLDALGKMNQAGKLDQVDNQDMLAMLLVTHDREASLLKDVLEALRPHEQTTLQVMVRQEESRRKEKVLA